MNRYDYIRDPAAIYRRSAELVRASTDLSLIPDSMQAMTLRLVHACGMPEIVDALAWSGSPSVQGRQALQAGAPILADCQMVVDGVISSRLPSANDVICTLHHDQVPQLQQLRQTTRSAAAVDLWGESLDGAVVAIGNAPTALFRLLELLLDEPATPPPALILAFPVGFVGAAESKTALTLAGLDIPYVTLTGRRGGSALAAAAVNSLCGPLDR